MNIEKDAELVKLVQTSEAPQFWEEFLKHSFNEEEETEVIQRHKSELDYLATAFSRTLRLGSKDHWIDFGYTNLVEKIEDQEAIKKLGLEDIALQALLAASLFYRQSRANRSRRYYLGFSEEIYEQAEKSIKVVTKGDFEHKMVLCTIRQHIGFWYFRLLLLQEHFKHVQQELYCKQYLVSTNIPLPKVP